MSVRQGTEVTCDRCGFTVPDYTTPAKLRDALRQLGWMTGQRGDTDYCPDHRPSRSPSTESETTT